MSCLRFVGLVCLLIPGGATVLSAQLEPPTSGGAVQLSHALGMLGHYKRVLLVGAHPDDEDTEFLTVMVRHEGAEAAYLSLNRGEGGQNLIGPELGVGLGILRTEELLAARRTDGARQFFTRAYDFGYSKTLEDTWAQWPHDSLLKDVVRVVRRFRPQIIVSVFSGTPRDGHAQHQAAGVLAHEAFRAAADSASFPELQREEGLAPWSVRKLYGSARFDTAATTVRLDGGELDHSSGRTFHQIAMASRSLHRSQDMGQVQTIGPSTVRLQFIASAEQGDRPKPRETSIWDGVDTTLAALPGMARTTAAQRAEFLALIERARSAAAGDASVAGLIARAAAILREGVGAGSATPEVEGQFHHLARAWQAASGLVFDARVPQSELLPGSSVDLVLEASGPAAILRRAALAPVVVPGTIWPSAEAESRVEADSGRGSVVQRVTLPVPQPQPLSNPYFLSRGTPNGTYDWRDAPPAWRGLPFEPDPVGGVLRQTDGALQLTRSASRRRNDQARGELRDPVEIVARLEVRLSPASIAWRLSDRSPRGFEVTLTHGASDTTRGEVRLEVPTGWPSVPAQRFTLTRLDEKRIFHFTVRPPATLVPGLLTFHATASDGTHRYDQGRVTIAYDHIRPRSYLEAADAHVRVMDLRLPTLARVGYVRGAADRVPEALLHAGVPIELLAGDALATAALDRYDAIVIGPRAYETDAGLMENNDRLLAYVHAGGMLIVQYQQYGFFTDNLAPYPLFVANRLPGTTTIDVATSRGAAASGLGTALLGGHDRVTDERAPVRMVAPNARELLSPNRIGPSDWEGWVQERGLYFARAWDKRYRTVIETHDPQEGPLEGGLLIADVGKGKYVYTGLAFFRQLPAGVPGAYRLFANLLALSVSGKR